MRESWRWFGPSDPVSLDDIQQAGATDIVSALHHLPNGVVWTPEEIAAHQRRIEWDERRQRPRPLRWSVVESIPVHEDIKRGLPSRDAYIAAYAESIRNLGAAGIEIVCYNFMPVLDWTRTQLDWELPDGSRALRFEQAALVAFDGFILQRKGAERTYSPGVWAAGQAWYEGHSEAERARLVRTLIAGLPGAEEGYSLDDFRAALAAYHEIGPAQLRENLVYFLKGVMPAAEAAGVRLAIHPDDPPFPLLGLPRVVSTEADVNHIFQAVPSLHNGLTFCTGSFGVRADNDLPGMVHRLGERIHFVHLRATRRDADGNFYEADHLDGDVDMYHVVANLLKEEQWRRANFRADAEIPMRPDHGHQMLDDLHKQTNPGYSAIGRLRGLAELRGLMYGLRRSLQVDHEG
ncbi:MAG: mannonate dehydratase [Bacteroidetes bacterium]|nr:MAG: mannonate dehydratase [Bacteroidota bacterium]